MKVLENNSKQDPCLKWWRRKHPTVSWWLEKNWRADQSSSQTDPRTLTRVSVLLSGSCSSFAYRPCSWAISDWRDVGARLFEGGLATCVIWKEPLSPCLELFGLWCGDILCMINRAPNRWWGLWWPLSWASIKLAPFCLPWSWSTGSILPSWALCVVLIPFRN